MSRWSIRLLCVVIAIAAVGFAALFWAGDIFLRGWLIGAGFWTSFSIGSLALLMIHRLTGGAWGNALGPVLRIGALSTPLAVLILLPIAFDLGVVYPWAAHPDAAPPGVAHYFLAPALFYARALIALVGWSILGIVFGMGAGGVLLAGLGLAFYGLMISVVSVDWFLSVAPDHPSTTFGAMIAIQQLLTALCVGALLSPVKFSSKTGNQIGEFLIATLLGVFYMELMTYIVIWYGDLPSKVKWYLSRSEAGWPVVAGVLTVLAGISFVLLLSRSGRESRIILQIVSAIVLCAIGIHFAWLIIPAHDDGQVTTAIAAALAIVGLSAASLTAAPSIASGSGD